MKYSKELHDEWRDYINKWTGANEFPDNGGLIGCLFDEIDRLNAERRWIPVSGAPINRRVYVLMPNNYVVIATKFKSLCKDPNHYLWRNDSGAICQVICWMPLPPAPESEG